MKRIPILFLLIFVFCASSEAQSLTGFGVSNQSGIYSVFSNPASAASSTNQFSLHMTGASLGIENNFLKSNLKYSLFDVASFKKYREGGKMIQEPYYTLNKTEVKDPQLNIEAEIVGPGIVFGLTKNIFVHAYMKDRFIGNFDKANWATVQFLDEKQFQNINNEGDYGLDMRSTSFRENGFGISAVVFEKRQSQIKAGVTYKRLKARYLKNINVPYFDVNADASGTQIQGRIIEQNSNNELNNGSFFKMNNADVIGKGNAFDIGLVYEFRPYSMKSTYRKYQLKGWNSNFKRNDHLKYKYRVSVALIDLGSIKYDNASIENSEYIINDVFESGSFADMDVQSYLESVETSGEANNASDDLVIALPKRMKVNFDRHIYKGMYASATATYSLQNANRNNLEFANSVGIQLRNEMGKFMWMIPFEIVPETNTYRLGAMLKAGPFFIGTNTIQTLYSKEMKNVSVFTGVLFNIPYKKDPTIENFKNIKFLKKQKKDIHFGN